MSYYTKSSPLFLPTKYVMVPQHGPFSLHTMLQGPWPHKMPFPTPMVWPLDESQGSSQLQGHGSWLMCEVALALCMDHQHVTCSLKYVIDHGAWGPQKLYFQANIINCHDPMGFAVREAKRGSLIAKVGDHGKETPLWKNICFDFLSPNVIVVERKEGEKVEHGKKNLKSTFFGHILKKSTHEYFGAWSLLPAHIRFIPSEGPKALQFALFGSHTMEVWPSKLSSHMGQLRGL